MNLRRGSTPKRPGGRQRNPSVEGESAAGRAGAAAASKPSSEDITAQIVPLRQIFGDALGHCRQLGNSGARKRKIAEVDTKLHSFYNSAIAGQVCLQGRSGDF